MPCYIAGDDLLSNIHEPPQALDEIRIEHRGITLHVYGFLHGVTGAGNKAYRDLVQRTIDRAPGMVMGEKGLKMCFKGISVDLEDWAAMSLTHTALFSFRLSTSPRSMASIFFSLFAESVRKKDQFRKEGSARLRDISGSPLFHRVSPAERRRVAGFSEPEAYMRTNLVRRTSVKGSMNTPAINFPSFEWAWLTIVEPYVNIPLRSLHMLEFATTYAKVAGTPEVSLFVGEIHNTDMEWLSTVLRDNGEISGDWTADQLVLLQRTRNRARDLGRLIAEGRGVAKERLIYMAAMYLGFMPTFFIIAALLWRALTGSFFWY